MKRAVLALVFALVLLASVAIADVTETGIAVVLSVGDEKRPIEALVFFSDMYGVPLSPYNGTIYAPKDECVNIQIWPKGATSGGAFDIDYTTLTVFEKDPKKRKKATFDPAYGWKIQLTPEDLAQTPELARALQLGITDVNGHKSYIRVVFKITYGSGRLTQYDQIVIKTMPRSQMGLAGGTGVNGASAAVDALKANQTKTAEYVSTLENRVTNLENYIVGLSSGSGPVSRSGSRSAAPAASSKELEAKFKGEFVFIKMYVDQTNIDNNPNFTLIKSASQKLSLPQGKHSIVLVVDYDGTGGVRKSPIPMEVGPEDKGFTIDVTRKGGA